MIRWLWSRMMKWGWDFNRDLYEDDLSMQSALNRSSRYRGENLILISDDEIDLTKPIRFSVQSVEGGILVETRWYDEKKDSHDRKLHIVTDKENLAEAIGKIVTMELLKR